MIHLSLRAKALSAFALALVISTPILNADQSEAPAEWFPQSRTPDPLERAQNGPFDSLRDFHLWAWQSFLWLTQETENGLLRFETFPTNHDVINGTFTTRAGNQPMKLLLRDSKRDVPNEAFDSINQAAEDGILVGHNGRAVYYSQYVNPQMFKDIISKDWNDPVELNKPRTIKALFETGDMEIKASWMVLEEEDNASSFFVRDAIVDKLVTIDGVIKPDPHTPLTVKVALVGFHVAGWVKDHPEAIWATFEHNDNAPDFKVEQDAEKEVSDRNFTFYSAGTDAMACNQLNGGALKLNVETQKLTPVTQAARQFPFGMKADTKVDDANLVAINQLNASVAKQLKPGNIWRNYFEVGAVWNNVPKDMPPIKPNDSLQKFIAGSSLLSNATIETFSQNIRSQNNCFSCHNTQQFNPIDPTIPPLQGTTLNTSHIIIEAYLKNQKKE